MRKRYLIVLGGLALLFGTTGLAGAEPSNPGFETGDFTDWTTAIPSGGDASVVTGHVGDSGMPYGPMEGSYFARLKTDGPGSYTTLFQSFGLGGGETIDGWAAFDAQDYLPFNDNAMVRILDALGTPIATPWYSDVATVGDYGDGPWTFWSWTAPSTDTYTLEYRVANDDDSFYDSYALFDATGVPGVIPEPSTLGLFGIGLLGAWRNRKKLGLHRS